MGDRPLPAVVGEGLLPEGKTVIHGHHASQEVWELCKLLRLDVRDGGMSMQDLRDALVVEWPDLEVSVQDLRKFLERYVDPYVVVPPGFFKKGLIQAGVNLNAVAEIAKVADKMQRKWESEEDNVGKVIDFDGEGNAIMGPSVKEWVGAGKQIIDARKTQMEEQARIDMAPEKKSAPVGGLNIVVPTVNINLKDAVGAGFDRKESLDADFKKG